MTQWKPIQEFDGFFEVSEYGDVRNSEKHRFPGRVRKARKHSKNNRWIVFFTYQGKLYGRVVSWLVAQAFLGPQPVNMTYVHYKDGNPNHLHYSNLYYSNELYKNQGENHHNVKITEPQAYTIKMLGITKALSGTEIRAKVAQQLNVHPRTISAVMHNNSWRWLKVRDY